MGRSYLIKDAASIAKGVEILIGVSDDVGCLFYHLLDNPTLSQKTGGLGTIADI